MKNFTSFTENWFYGTFLIFLGKFYVCNIALLETMRVTILVRYFSKISFFEPNYTISIGNT